MDPYKVLGVPYDSTLLQIRAQFKKKVLRFHPDKPTGDAIKFQKLKEAYTYLYRYKKAQEKIDKKRNFVEYLKDRNTDINQEEHYDIDPTHMNYAMFNKAFDKTHTKGVYHEGRENFLKKKTPKKKMQIAIVKEPKSLQSGNFIELGVEAIDDYSTYVCPKNKKQVPCSDIKHAFQNKHIIEGNMKNTRQDSFLSRDTAIERAEPATKMSEKDKLWYMMNKKMEIAKEEKRRFLMERQNRMSERQFLRVKYN